MTKQTEHQTITYQQIITDIASKGIYWDIRRSQNLGKISLSPIQLLESPIPAAAPPAAAPPSQKASTDDISGTKRGTIDPLVSKQPEKILKKKVQKKKKKKKYLTNGKKWSKLVKMVKMV